MPCYFCLVPPAKVDHLLPQLKGFLFGQMRTIIHAENWSQTGAQDVQFATISHCIVRSPLDEISVSIWHEFQGSPAESGLGANNDSSLQRQRRNGLPRATPMMQYESSVMIMATDALAIEMSK
jgi:hypothetical protein